MREKLRLISVGPPFCNEVGAILVGVREVIEIDQISRSRGRLGTSVIVVGASDGFIADSRSCV